MCTYGAEVDEDYFEAAVLAKTGMKTPWIRYTLEEFVERLERDLPSCPEETHAPAEAPPAPAAPAEAPAAADVILNAQAFPRDRFAAVKLTAAPAGRGRSKGPIMCPVCKQSFHSSDAKYNHVRRD